MTAIDSMGERVTYQAGDLVAVRGSRAVALIDDRGTSPDAAFGLIAAVSGGSSDSLLPALRQAADQLRGFGVIWLDGDHWSVAHMGSTVVTIETPMAISSVLPKSGELHEFEVGSDTLDLKLHGDDFLTQDKSTDQNELATGAMRGSVITLAFADRPQSARVESQPVRVAAVVETTPATSPPAQPTVPEPTRPPKDTPPSPKPSPQPTPAEPTGLPPSERASQPPPPTPSRRIEVQLPPPDGTSADRSSTAQLRLVEFAEGPVAAAPLPLHNDSDMSRDRAVDVLGVRCPADHHNHPDALYCSQCGRRMGVNQTAVARPGPRPPLGLFLIDDIATFAVAEDFIIGRAPQGHPDVVDGAHSLTLDDEARAISRAHTAIRLDGWDVTAIDLGSANGTFLRRAAATEWEVVSSEQPSTLYAGDVLKIGGRELQLELHHVQT